ncbi:recombinase family protein [Aquimarina sp. RZ0]|uniref:recombinase family protein n=1 Tax=Aquimarina sp. RZ0 TaxID=2607730 RepID=UPI0011F305B5|nr:recombinase family protein [Aquimarina sp. RZ0]KAA1242443.1 recombinase family protein [Aquimarina sp. RZ0]
METQKTACESFAQRKGLNVSAFFGGTYESAKSDERKEFTKMLNYVKRKKDISYIIVYSYERFSRTGANGAYISDQLKKQGIVTLSATQDLDPLSSSGNFQQNMFYMWGQFDNDQRRDKSVTGMQKKLREGHRIWLTPFGYTNLNPGNGKTPHYVINEQGKLLKNAFLLKANHNMAHTEIAQKPKEKGLHITDKKLSKYFRNPFYCGIIINSLLPGEVIEGKHEAMIPKETFLRIHNLLNSREEGVKYTLEDNNLPLKMFIRSASCNTPYTGYVVRKKGLYYYKNRRKGSKENKSARIMHLQFKNLLISFSLQDKNYIPPFKEILTYTFLEMNKELIADMKRKEVEFKKIQTKLDRLEERFVFDEISKDQYDKFRHKLESEKHEIEELIGKNDFKSSNLEKSIDSALQYSLNLPSLWESGDIQTKRALQYMIFPDGILYDFKNDAFRTPRVNLIFDSISLLSHNLEEIKKGNQHSLNEDSLLVGAKGFEPLTPWV